MFLYTLCFSALCLQVLVNGHAIILCVPFAVFALLHKKLSHFSYKFRHCSSTHSTAYKQKTADHQQDHSTRLCYYAGTSIVEEHNFLKGAITQYWCRIASFPSNNMNEPQPKLDWPRGLESTPNQGYTVHIHGESFLIREGGPIGFGRKMQIRIYRWALIKVRVCHLNCGSSPHHRVILNTSYGYMMENSINKNETGYVKFYSKDDVPHVPM